MKPHKHSVALVIKNDKAEFLIVKRPEDEDGPLAGLWGFPAITLKENETEVDAARRVGPTKLGVEVKVGDKIGERSAERDTCTLHLSDYAATISDGETPRVPQSDTTVTQYVDVKYSSDPSELFVAAQRGSECSRIYLQSIGIDWSAFSR
ncbi:MAG TPA: NUDIX domain-containing protein [Mycobacterium sp.]|uniref:NUDIX domain-containing protein n=1 Tax=Mycobacterium sp. TaxID=1785 RepID=UPI002D62266D|nr:NUDIX domain-containing protein [Mycobacterium sp.]HZU45870.1 NUDIX domain-containing protein [Mycobacterium sp.]